MRAFLVACLLAGCYQPSTESCYYRCASAANNACPSGLECNNGMCVTPGEQCPTGTIDAPPRDGDPDAPPIDAPRPLCGDGIRVAGEVCFEAPQQFTNTEDPLDAVLADRDGDLDMDLVYITTGTNGNYRSHIQNTAGQLPTVGFGAPNFPNAVAMRAVNLNMVGSSEFIGINDAQISTLTFSGGNLTEITSGVPLGPVRGAVVGKITSGPFPDLVVLRANNVDVYSYDLNVRMSIAFTSPISGLVPQDIAVGRINGDAPADFVAAMSTGITWWKGNASGQINDPAPTGVMGQVQAIELGDVDGDGKLDIVFVQSGATAPGGGVLGVVFGNGDGTFQVPVTVTAANVADALEVRDLDGDNRDDIVFVRGGTMRALGVSLGRADRMISMPTFIGLPGSSAQITVRGSFNGDAVPDIVVTDRSSRVVYVFASDP